MAGKKAASQREESKTSLDSPEREQARTKFKAEDLDERVGYYGEHLVLLAQTLGLNTCWVGLSYTKVPGTYVLDEGEKIACYIAIGYGETQGVGHKIKAVGQVSNASDATPSWFRKGVEAALLAPTAVNQQKFSVCWCERRPPSSKCQERLLYDWLYKDGFGHCQISL